MTVSNILRIPLAEHDKDIPARHFPKMPVLYLELLENKTKVKRSLVNKNYEPPIELTKPRGVADTNLGPVTFSPRPLNALRRECNKEVQPIHQKHRLHDPRFDYDPRSINPTPTLVDDPDQNFENDADSVVSITSLNSSLYTNKVTTDRRPAEIEDRTGLRTDQNQEDKTSEETMQNKLDKLLGATIPDLDLQSPPAEGRYRETPVPTLSDLQRQKKVVIDKEYGYAEDDEQTQEERNALYFKYEVLRRMHPNTHIPEVTPYSDPKALKAKYDILTKKLSLNTTVDNWKRYLIVAVMACEVALGKVNFDMEGFAQQQITQMSTYDQLLVEIAEKNQTPTQSRWGPEVRLGMMMSLNVVLFVVSKMIFKKTGHNLLGTINNTTLFANNSQDTMKEPDS